MLFTCVQAYEYIHAPFAFKNSIYGATFFMATGFHGFHVIIGTIFLLVCLLRAMRGDFTPKQHFGFEAAAWYWHFVDVVWLFLFSCIYVWGGRPARRSTPADGARFCTQDGRASRGRSFFRPDCAQIWRMGARSALPIAHRDGRLAC